MADGETAGRAKFHAMTEGTQEDWANIIQHTRAFSAAFPDRLLTHLKLLEGDCGGFAVDRMEHSLQTASRAFRDGRDEEYVVCALIHTSATSSAPRTTLTSGRRSSSRSSPSRTTG
jgi:hypothetical protein